MMELDLAKTENILTLMNIPVHEIRMLLDNFKDYVSSQNTPFMVIKDVLFEKRFGFWDFIHRYYAIDNALKIVDWTNKTTKECLPNFNKDFGLDYFISKYPKHFINAFAGKEETFLFLNEIIFKEGVPAWDFFLMPQAASRSEIKRLKPQVLRVINEEVFGDLIGLLNEHNKVTAADRKLKEREIADTKESPEEGLFNQMLGYAYRRNASDIHIIPSLKNDIPWINVDLRINGDITPLFRDIFYDPKFHEAVIRLIRAKANMIGDMMDGAFGHKGISWRVNAMSSGWDGKEAVTLRKLDPKTVLHPLDQVFLHPKIMKAVRYLQKHYKSGFMIVSGKTGSGKTTSLYSFMYDSVNRAQRKINIKTIEDPIEYLFPQWLIQHQVSKYQSEERILKGLLRADPNWILAGEIRAKEFLEVAVNAVLSGHLTMATFHAGTVADTIIRFNNYGYGFEDILDTVRLIICQDLLKKLCPDCRIKQENGLFKKGLGCTNCSAGYKGCVVIAEYLLIDPDDFIVRDALINFNKQKLQRILEQRFITKLQYWQWAIGQGYLPYDDQQIKI